MPEEILYTFTQSLTYSHIGQAVDSMRRSYDLSVSGSTGWEKMSAQQFAMSSIVHGFCFLESLVNERGYKLLFDKNSKEYIPYENRDFLLNKFVSNWNMIRSLDKITFLLEKFDLAPMNPVQRQKFAEINNLRNLLVHGATYDTTMLLEPIGDSYSKIHDQEDSIDWSKKFAANKFNSPTSIDFSDAQKCLDTILNVCKQFYLKHSIGLGVSTSYPERRHKTFYGNEINFDELLQLPVKLD